MLDLAEVVKYEAWQEATKSREALQESLTNAYQRYRHYQRLLGTEGSTLTEPHVDALDTDAMEKARYGQREPTIDTQDATISVAKRAPDVAAGHNLSPEEGNEL